VKGSRLAVNSLVVSLFLVGTFNLNSNSQPSSNWLRKAVGSYQSKIWSSGNLISGKTEFRKTNDSSLEGSYMMNEKEESVSGKLSQCQAIQLRVMRCAWNDKYGTGSLEITFSENFSTFNGYWGEGSSEPVFRWSGSR
jgi:hypothetical protein